MPRNGIGRLTPIQTLALGFVAIILIGAALLCLPCATRAPGGLPFIDALFTAASATCVTGLIVYDTYTTFTPLGQVVILLLIQVGGLGFLTVAASFSMLSGKRIGLKERSLLMESVSAPALGGVVRLVKRVLIGTVIIELFGALILYTRFAGAFGYGKGAWFSVFHAVSAFCNAGFDLMGTLSPYTSLSPFAGDAVVNLAIMSLILIGGVGFWVWSDLRENKLRFSKYRLHTKIMLATSAALVIIPWILFLILERDHTLAGLPWGEKLLCALFDAVTPRTAGFNTTDTAALSNASGVLTVLLMMIGGGAGSTAGGIKVTTFAVTILSFIAFWRGKNDVTAFGRRLDPIQIRKANSSVVLYLTVYATGVFLLCAVEPMLPLRDILFEVASAIGTVGMSTGVTRALSPVSRVIVAILMYIGRVGSLSLLMAVLEKRPGADARYPEEKIII